jgi:uncharacterized protein
VTRVAIVGGSGLIGRALTRSLAADGHSVVVLSRSAAKAARRVSPGVEVRGWSADDVDGLAAILDGIDVVVSVGGTPVGPWRWTRRRKASIVSSRVVATRSIVDAMERLASDRRPRTFVVVSGVDAYPESDGTANPTAMTEATPIGDGFLAVVSRAVEGEAMRAGVLEVRVVCMRLGQVLARDAYLMRILTLPVRLFMGGRMGSGEQWLSWIHIDDAVGLWRLAIADGGPSGIVNLVAPGACRQVDFVRAMARVLHRPTRVRVRAWLIRLVLGEQSTLLLGSRRVAPTRALELGYAFRYPTIDAAMKEVLR